MFYPIMINTKNLGVIIFGGGQVAYRKTKTFIEYGMNVKVISPYIIEEFKNILNRIDYVEDVFKEEYIQENNIIVVATSSRDINHTIFIRCKEKGLLCNVVDSKEESDFIMPSTFKKDSIVAGISTQGNSPYFAAKLRRKMEEIVTEDMIEKVNEMGKIRELVMEKCVDEKARKRILKDLVDLSLKELKDRRIVYENCCRIKGK
ncbi:bifunctional precorrin-2 dehydrogenase/sirohydrochlorin ferrochelatase [Clostridium sp. D2Q-14]|uniref:precorrin-2 dehydrogenase/sirohydrochlorin ferrochelatase family protein n=1 Tax=Anaeromonas gelatinilytica TaxID=2683194 RepID=UPI00193B68E9|nr:bifunctional precorrin-2 dehydrogenase/sirohydrochlorin ferrochelatase [Anaeromonas gelatinilytica]MBS4535479.1 bifunctional precorrin-2 dehydrogenase/sirohydrochlorin ferrochelatase [Anaeromonas gelatinilytica]